jgi:hypothetical protein
MLAVLSGVPKRERMKTGGSAPLLRPLGFPCTALSTGHIFVSRSVHFLTQIYFSCFHVFAHTVIPPPVLLHLFYIYSKPAFHHGVSRSYYNAVVSADYTNDVFDCKCMLSAAGEKFRFDSRKVNDLFSSPLTSIVSAQGWVSSLRQ